MKTDQEQLIEELIQRAKTRASLFGLPKDAATQNLFKLIENLNNIPKAQVPQAQFERVKNQILDRIAIPKTEKSTALGGFLQTLPSFIRIGSGIIGTLLILMSLTLGTAIAAIQSLPGSPIYPLKQVVENIQLHLAHNENDKTNLQIKFANNRLEELETVLQQNQEGKVSSASVQKLVEKTVRDINNTASRVSQNSTTAPQPPVQILSKIVDLNNKQTALLQAASINSEGEVRIELEKALEASKTSQEQTLQNIERAGLKVDDSTIIIDDQSQPNDVEAHGKLTAVTSTSVSIGTAKFLLTKDTKFVDTTATELKVDQIVSIKAQVIQSKTYALEIDFESQVDQTIDITLPPPPPPPTNSSTTGSGQ